ncbi:MAG: glutamate-5-semialdehyde dehydrogenase [Candidatus Hydrogenedentes bacterium]|nr:glutamate-5-semialdehyde dehydrogenase [Candidatus Hydrogenedentota bacterium]
MAEQDQSLQEQLERLGRQARQASAALRSLTSAVKNAALRNVADALRSQRRALQQANELDLAAGREKGLSGAMLDRLALTDKRVDAMAEGLEAVAMLPDPVGNILEQYIHPNGLRIARIRQPIGVVGIIYESRPNVTADAAALCLKSGNATILRGGSEAFHSNRAIAQVFVEGATAAGVHEHAVQMLGTTDRAAVGELLKLDAYIDVIVPRGGKGLIARIQQDSLIPVIAHLDGVCHTYVHEDADPGMAETIAFNAKMQRTGVCNAMETMLVHEAIAPDFLPPMAKRLQDAGCELRGCERTQALISCKPATEEDWRTEYLDSILSIRIVSSLEEAIDHINTYGSHHSDAIVTRGYGAAERFLDAVDSATVYVNASTRFTDGFEFGMGAEIGISTNKLHWRGPMALEGLTTFKYVVRGMGQIRE